LKYQDKGQNMSHIVSHIEGFRKKWKLFEVTLQKVIRHIFHHVKNWRKMKMI
jgi:hypothetical protein